MCVRQAERAWRGGTALRQRLRLPLRILHLALLSHRLHLHALPLVPRVVPSLCRVTSVPALVASAALVPLFLLLSVVPSTRGGSAKRRPSRRQRFRPSRWPLVPAVATACCVPAVPPAAPRLNSRAPRCEPAARALLVVVPAPRLWDAERTSRRSRGELALSLVAVPALAIISTRVVVRCAHRFVRVEAPHPSWAVVSRWRAAAAVASAVGHLVGRREDARRTHWDSDARDGVFCHCQRKHNRLMTEKRPFG